MWLNISVHYPHTVTVVQGLKEQQTPVPHITQELEMFSKSPVIKLKCSQTNLQKFI